MWKRLVDTITVRRKRSQSLVESVSIASIFPPYSSDTESETSSASNGSSPRFSCSIDTLFPPARSPSQSPPPEDVYPDMVGPPSYGLPPYTYYEIRSPRYEYDTHLLAP